MTSQAFTILVPSELFGHEPELFAQTQLADKLRDAGFSDVAIKLDDKSSAAGDAFLLLLSSEPSPWMLALASDERAQVLARTFVLLGVRAPSILDVLERHRIAGGVESMRYSKWKGAPDADNGYGVVGLRAVVERIGGECADDPYRSEHYCVYRSRSAQDLPQAIAEYARGWQRQPS